VYRFFNSKGSNENRPELEPDNAVSWRQPRLTSFLQKCRLELPYSLGKSTKAGATPGFLWGD
jgi:hypothetical protein